MLGWSSAEAGARLLEEAGLGLRVAGQLGRQELQRHRALEAEVLGLVDHPHAAAAEVARATR